MQDAWLLPQKEPDDPEGIRSMNQKVQVLTLRLSAAIAAFSLAGFPLHAQEKDSSRKPPQSAEVVLVRGPVSPAQLLPDFLGSFKATGEAREYHPDSLAELAGERSSAFREYRVLTAASRLYGTARVDVFQVENMFAAFGLFTYDSGLSGATTLEKAIGFDSAGLFGRRALPADSSAGATESHRRRFRWPRQ